MGLTLDINTYMFHFYSKIKYFSFILILNTYYINTKNQLDI